MTPVSMPQIGAAVGKRSLGKLRVNLHFLHGENGAVLREMLPIRRGSSALAVASRSPTDSMASRSLARFVYVVPENDAASR
jgi:hypothetical protein